MPCPVSNPIRRGAESAATDHVALVAAQRDLAVGEGAVRGEPRTSTLPWERTKSFAEASKTPLPFLTVAV